MILSKMNRLNIKGVLATLSQKILLFDILRIKDGILVEHWDVIQDEATQEQSKSGLPMFGDKFPE
jgi:predicted SnoaL-like aldol condensation-catalyzing enzyme